MSSIWQTKNNSRKDLGGDIKVLLDAAAATDWLGPKTAPILLKPNLVVSKPASGGATTHPEVVAGMIEYLLDNDFSNIAVAEGSWVGDSTEKAYKICGYTELSKRYNINLIDLQKDSAVTVKIEGNNYKLCASIADLFKAGGSLINLPVLKGHGQTHLTCALKNIKGCIPDSEKRRYHSLGVHKPVAMINTIIKPAFTLVDGLNGDPGWEEGGSPEKRDLLLLARDPVSLDTHACRLLGIRAETVSYIAIAEDLGIGSADVSESDIIIMNDKATDSNRNSPVKSNQLKIAAVKKRISRIVDQRSACSACFGNLSGALREIHEESGTELFTDNFILIGQDFKETKLSDDKIGIGICTCGSGAVHKNALKGCPPSQAAIKKFLQDLKR